MSEQQFVGEGWWEQDWFGRQSMEGLTLTIRDGQLSGSGWDMVGAFSLLGQINGNQVAILKQYLGKHQVQYYGTYDGEGVLAGQWRIEPFAGRWSISLTPVKNVQDDDIRELR